MRKRTLKKALVLACSTIMVTMLVGLSTSTFGAEGKGDPIKFGVLLPMTGGMTGYSHPLFAGLEYAAEKINATGGILGRPIKLILKDDKLNPEVGLREAKSLILSEGCTFIAGCFSSAVALAVSNYVKELNGKAFYIVSPAQVSGITEEYGHRYMARVGGNSIAWIRGSTYEAIRRYPNAKRIYSINPNYVYGQTNFAEFKRVLAEKAPGAEIVGEAWPPLGTKDYTGYISAMINAKPDLIQSTLPGGDAVTFFKQAEPFGLLEKFKIVNPDVGLQEALNHFRKGDQGVPIGVLGTTNYAFYRYENKAVTDFYTYIHKKTGYYPGGAIGGYPALILLKAAMEKAGTTTDLEKIINALEDLTVSDPIYGRITMRGCDHQVLSGAWVGPVAWDKTGKFPFPILDSESTAYIPAEKIFHTCDEIKALREAEAKKSQKRQ